METHYIRMDSNVNAATERIVQRLADERRINAGLRAHMENLDTLVASLQRERDFYKLRAKHLETEVNNLKTLRIQDAPTIPRAKAKSINGVTIE
jgi:hypothetical protein